MSKKLLTTAVFLLGTQIGFSQSTTLPLGTEDYSLLDRIETKSGHLSDNLFTTQKGVQRKSAVEFLLAQKNRGDSVKLTDIDLYNMERMISINGEWTPDENGAVDSKHSWFNTFYKKQSDFIHVKNDGLF